MALLYVDNAVPGPGSGTFADPWDDISSNMGSVSAGDTVNFRGNVGAPRVYNEGEIDITATGSSGSPIVFQPYPGEEVVWQDGVGDETFNIIGDYIILQNFEIDKQDHGDRAIDIDGDHCTVQGCTIYDGAFDQFIRIRGDDTSIINCTLYNNHKGPGFDSSGITIVSGDPVYVTGCTIYDMYGGDCLVALSSAGVVGDVIVDSCEFYTTLGNLSEDGLDAKQGTWTVTNCVFHGFYATTYGGSGSPFGAGSLAHNYCSGITYENCTFYDCTTGIGAAIGSNPVTIKECLFYELHPDALATVTAFVYFANLSGDVLVCKNTFHDDNGISFNVDNSTFTFRNNIIDDAGTIDDTSATVTADHNCWNNATDTWSGAGDVNADPEFTDPANDDYTLSAISPCIDAGTVTGCSVPYNGTAPDMGAFEFTATPEPPPATSEGEPVTPLPSTIAPRWESKQLSASLYKPEIGSYTPRGTLVLDNLSELWTSYRHTKKRIGGYWDATITQRGNLSEIEDWIFRLGYHLEVYNPALERIWEGFVNRVRLQIGGFTVERGPLLDVVNRGYLVYSTVDTTTEPPTVGVRAVSAAVEDTNSQERYGILEKYASAGGVSADAVTDIITVYVDENARPRTGKRWNNRNNVFPTATIELLGYVHFLKMYVFNSTTSGTRTLPLKIQDILGGDPNAVFSTDYSKIDPDGVNTQTIKRYNNNNQTAWAQIKSIAARGDGTTPWSFGIYNDRQAFYDIAPTDWEYSQRLLDPAQRVFEYGGPEVAPWDVQPGKLMLATDFLIGKTPTATTAREDERTTFIEQVSYISPDVVDIVGGQFNTLSQRLATLGLSGIG